MRAFLLFSLLCALHVTLGDRVRDRQHREWRRKAATLREDQPYQTAVSSLPSEPTHIHEKRATTGTGVWTSTGPTATVIITTARISSRCGAAFGTRTVCPTGASCQSIKPRSSTCRSTTVASPSTTPYVTTGTGVWTSTGPDRTVIVTTARTSARCGAAFGTRTVCVPGYTCALATGATSICRTATPATTSSKPTSTLIRTTSSTTPTSRPSSSAASTTRSSSSTTTSPTTTSTSITCAPKYTGGATTITGTGTLPKATSYVTRSGTQLMLSGKAYRPVGPNIYWLGLDENVGPYQYPSKQRVREAMAISVAMGANTIRSHTLGISVGVPLSVEPSLNTFNDAAFDAIDYALYAAREYGLRVVIPLTDEHDYYHGGRYTFLRWLGTNQSNYGSQFYTNRTVINTYRTYISRILNRYNQYSKTYYYNDPTILAWETGNELGGYIGRTGYPPLSWTDEIASLIKSIAKNTLVMDGTNGIWNYTTGATAPGLKSANIDIMSDHLYPLNNGILNQELGYVQQNNKAFVIAEYDWTGEYGGSSLTDFLTASEKTSYLGDMPWSVFGHDDQCCAFVPHLDGFSIYYPNGNTAAQQTRILQMVQHNYRLTGRTAPSSLPAVACPQRAF